MPNTAHHEPSFIKTACQKNDKMYNWKTYQFAQRITAPHSFFKMCSMCSIGQAECTVGFIYLSFVLFTTINSFKQAYECRISAVFWLNLIYYSTETTYDFLNILHMSYAVDCELCFLYKTKTLPEQFSHWKILLFSHKLSISENHFGDCRSSSHMLQPLYGILALIWQWVHVEGCRGIIHLDRSKSTVTAVSCKLDLMMPSVRCHLTNLGLLWPLNSGAVMVVMARSGCWAHLCGTACRGWCTLWRLLLRSHTPHPVRWCRAVGSWSPAGCSCAGGRRALLPTPRWNNSHRGTSDTPCRSLAYLDTHKYTHTHGQTKAGVPGHT